MENYVDDVALEISTLMCLPTCLRSDPLHTSTSEQNVCCRMFAKSCMICIPTFTVKYEFEMIHIEKIRKINEVCQREFVTSNFRVQRWCRRQNMRVHASVSLRLLFVAHLRQAQMLIFLRINNHSENSFKCMLRVSISNQFLSMLLCCGCPCSRGCTSRQPACKPRVAACSYSASPLPGIKQNKNRCYGRIKRILTTQSPV